MTAQDVEQAVRAFLKDHAEVPADPHAPLDLPSLTLVMLVEHFEEAFSFRAHPKDMSPTNFATLANMVRYFESKAR